MTTKELRKELQAERDELSAKIAAAKASSKEDILPILMSERAVYQRIIDKLD